MKDTLSRRSIALPLIALILSWAVYLLARYTDLFVTPVYDDEGTWIGQDPAIQIAPYLLFLAVAIFGVAAVLAQRLAIAQRVALGADERLPRSAHRFATLAIVVALAFAAILGIGAFLEGFRAFGPRSDDLGLRFLTTYLPILLNTTLVVVILLAGFVLRKDTLPKSDDKAKALEADGQESEAPAEARRSLGAAYALPIVAVASALIFGLIVFDVTGTTLEVWVWVIIQAIIGAGIVVGTIFGEKAMAAGPRGTTSRSRITRSARGLNFVLSIVFGAVVTIMGFSYGTSAVNSLRISPSLSLDVYAITGTPVANTTISVNGWDLAQTSTVEVTLQPGGETLLTGEVDAFRGFYQDFTLPALTPGSYVLEGNATSVDGQPVTRSLEFGVAENGTLIWNPKFEERNRVGDDNARVMAPSLPWLIDDLAPALVLILLAQTGIFVTMTRRNSPR